MKVGAVVITMGNRPAELRALLDSVAEQDGAPVEVVVVGNGAPVPDVPEGVRTVELPENLGIPGGRNVGIEAFGPSGAEVDVLLFLDDDGLLANTGHRRAVPQGLRRRPGAGHHQLPDRRPGDRRHPAPPRPEAARRRPDALLARDDLPRRRQRRAHPGVRARSAGCPTSSSTPTRRPTSRGGRSTPAG